MADFIEQHMFLRVIDGLHGIEQPGFVIAIPRSAGQGLNIFRETGTTVTTTGIDEVITNARIRANTTANVFDIRTQPFRQIGYFVHETDFGRQHGVGGVFGELRGADVHEDHAVVTAVERIVNLVQQFHGAFTVSADNDAVRLHEVGNRGAFFQEFRVGNHIEFQLQASLVQPCPHSCLDLISGPDRDSGLVHHHLVVVHVLAD